MNLCFVFCHRQLSSIHENSQTEGVGNEVRQRASKDLANNLNLAVVTIYLFFYFSVVLVVIGEKSPQLWVFPRRWRRDSNEVGNGLSFSEWKLHLLRDLHKTVHRFFGRVVGVRCRDFTLPALLSAIFRKHSWIGKVVPPGNALVHYLVDFPDFPLLRLVKGVI